MATITKQGKSYKITASGGYNINGKQIRRHMTWTPSPGMTPKQEEKELQRQAVLFEERCKTGQLISGSVKLVDFIEQWFANYAEKQLRPHTMARYKEMIVRINSALGHIRLDRLQPHHLLAFYDNLSEAGMRKDTKYHSAVDFKSFLKKKGITQVALASAAGLSEATLRSAAQGKNISKTSAERICAALKEPLTTVFKPVEGADTTLAARTILHHHRLLSSILSTAVQWQIITANPCARVKPPKAEKTDPQYLDETEAKKLVELLEQEPFQYQTMIHLLLFLGCRRGELLGLEWQDIDFTQQIIHIRRSSQYVPGKGVFEDQTKNASSRRVIKAPAAVIDTLREYKVWQNEQILRVGDQWQETHRLFTTWNGKPMHPDTLTCWFRDFVARSDLPHISVHSLRHTNATLQIAGGVPLPTVAKRLGHTTAATTTRIYAHAIKSADEAAAETLQDILVPSKNRHKTG